MRGVPAQVPRAVTAATTCDTFFHARQSWATGAGHKGVIDSFIQKDVSMKKFAILAGTAILGVAAAGIRAGATDRCAGVRHADVTRQQVMHRRTDQRFQRLDINSDGRATADEARQAGEQRRAERAGRMFERLDANRDGSVSRAEFDQAQAQRMARRGERGEHGRGMGGMHRGHGWGGMRGERGEQMFGEQGFVTRDQMRERALARFDRADANRDGTLTVAERQQGREQFRQHRQERRSQTN
jgi:hypothetical protein